MKVISAICEYHTSRQCWDHLTLFLKDKDKHRGTTRPPCVFAVNWLTEMYFPLFPCRRKTCFSGPGEMTIQVCRTSLSSMTCQWSNTSYGPFRRYPLNNTIAGTSSGEINLLSTLSPNVTHSPITPAHRCPYTENGIQYRDFHEMILCHQV